MGWFSDFFEDPFDSILDIVDGVGGAVADVADSTVAPVVDKTGAVFGDALNWTVETAVPLGLQAAWTSWLGGQAGLTDGGMFSADGMLADGTYMSGMDLAADGGVGNMWGMDAGFGSALGNVADGAGVAEGTSNMSAWDLGSYEDIAASSGDYGTTPEWFGGSEPWRTSGDGMRGTSLGELGSKVTPEWAKSPEGLAKKGGETFLKEKIGGYFKDQKMSDLVNTIAGMQSRNTQGNVGTGTRQGIEDMYSKINGLYAEGSPELMQMRQAMERKDAAAGRRSQYGPRETELAGNIAKYKADAIQRVGTSTFPQYMASLNTSANRNSGLYSALNKTFGGTTLNDVINGISPNGGGFDAWAKNLGTGSHNGDQFYG